MKHSFLKRLTAIVLVVIMVVSMIPAFAIGVGAAEVTYKLEQVYSIESGEKYVITYGSNAMKATVSSGRLGYSEIDPNADTIDPMLVWQISQVDGTDYYTLYNAETGKYAASTGAKNKAQLLEDATDTKAQWTVTAGTTFEFINVANAAAGVSKNLRNNGTYGFACYSTSTGGALTLYKVVEVPAGDPECQHTNTETIPAVPATCTTPGKTEGTKCSDCGYIVTQPENTALADHTDNGAGVCSVCGKYLTSAAIVDAAYGLASGASLANGPYTLSGVITSVDEAYNTQYSNVTVTMAVTGAASDKPIKCYRLKGTGADLIAVGTTITVTGQLKNYNGTIEFDSGCTLDSYTLCQHTDTVIIGVDKDPTCTEEGSTAGEKCSVCGTIIVEETTIDPLGHKDANGDSKCDTCQVSLCTEHSWIDDTDNEANVDATCIATGLMAQVCEKCGEPGEARVLDKVAHTTVIDEAVAPTCVATGLTEGSHCSACDEVFVKQTVVDMVDHNYVDNKCTVCGDIIVTGSQLADFEFGENGDASHKDGSAIAADTEYKSGDYTLKFTAVTSVYGSAFDAMGNSALKLGTSKVGGSFTFTVPANVNLVVIYIAGYKANTANVEINGTSYTVTTPSNDGAYTKIVVDTSENKTVDLATTSGGYRAMVNSIEFWGEATPSIKSFGLSLNKGVTVRVSYDIPLDWLAANPGATLVFKNGDTVIGEPIAAVAGKNTYSVDLTPTNINAALTVILQTADGTVIGSRDVSVATYAAMVKAESMTAATLGLSDAKFAALKDLLAKLETYGSVAAGSYEGTLEESFTNVGELIPDQDADKKVFEGVGATLGEYATVKLNINTANIADTYTLTVSLWENALITNAPIADSITADRQIVIANLFPANFDSNITITVSDGETVVATASFTFNEYLKALYNNSAVTAETKTLIAAIYQYGVAAAAYVSAT